jgi:hypothetical protein
MLEDGGTWYDYFQQQTLQYMTQITALSEYAKKNNITLDDTEKANIDTQMQTYASQATSGRLFLHQELSHIRFRTRQQRRAGARRAGEIRSCLQGL